MIKLANKIYTHRIAIDALATGGKSGVLSYFLKLCTYLPNLYPDIKFVVFLSDSLANEVGHVPANLELVICPLEHKQKFGKFLYEQFFLPAILYKYSIDLLYILSVTDVFLAPCKTVVRVGNMLPYDDVSRATHKDLRTRFRLAVLSIISKITFRSANGVLVMSAAAAAILKEKYPRVAHKLTGINRGVSLPELGSDEGLEAKVSSLPSEFILVSSHLQEHKRLIEVLEAYANLSFNEGKIPLVFIGSTADTEFFNRLREHCARLGISDDVHFTGFVERNQLREIYRRSVVTIFPSMTETCPVTLLEEMVSGCSLVVSDRSVMPGLCGDSVLYYEPLSSEELTVQIQKYLDSPSLRLKMSQAAIQRTEQLEVDWKRSFEKRMDYFFSIISR